MSSASVPFTRRLPMPIPTPVVMLVMPMLARSLKGT